MVRVLEHFSSHQARPVAILILCAITCLTLAILTGVAGTFAYSEEFRSVAGLTLQHLRPLHTTFAVAWIYLAACAAVYCFLISQAPRLPRAFWLRLKFQLVLWGSAGLGALITLPMGIFSGREYIGGHWILSVLIYLGWILFAWNFFSVMGFNLKGKPAFVYMWYTSLLLFLWAFAEGHGWLLGLVSDFPLRDLAIQYKSYGPLVGSFNLLVYGSLAYLVCCLSGNSKSAYSNTAFFLLFVGTLNSFTNFGHHTYHVPQTHVVKWISFIISMTESIIVCQYLLQFVSLLRQPDKPQFRVVGFLVRATMLWSFFLVVIALLISIPPVNAIIHGTHFIMAHAMGSMLGIDSMVLWAVLLYIIQRMVPAEHRLNQSQPALGLFWVINLAMFLLVGLLSVKGVLNGYLRYLGPAAPAEPAWLVYFPEAFMVLGGVLAVALLYVNTSWFLAVAPLARKGRIAGAPVTAPDSAGVFVEKVGEEPVPYRETDTP